MIRSRTREVTTSTVVPRVRLGINPELPGPVREADDQEAPFPGAGTAPRPATTIPRRQRSGVPRLGAAANTDLSLPPGDPDAAAAEPGSTSEPVAPGEYDDLRG